MKILVTGATGFIGKALAVRLLRGGHQVVTCVHRSTNQYLPPGVDVIAVDFMRDTDEDAWLARLVGIDAVINAVGILRETRHASFAHLHHRAPQALFRACEISGVKRVIQISALGADGQAQSKYHRSKKVADDALRGSDLDWTIVQPSVVFGSGGASTSLFLQLASMTLIPLVGNGEQHMQPLHIDDLSVLVMILLEQRQAIKQTIAAVGPTGDDVRNAVYLPQTVAPRAGTFRQNAAPVYARGSADRRYSSRWRAQHRNIKYVIAWQHCIGTSYHRHPRVCTTPLARLHSATRCPHKQTARAVGMVATPTIGEHRDNVVRRWHGELVLRARRRADAARELRFFTSYRSAGLHECMRTKHRPGLGNLV